MAISVVGVKGLQPRAYIYTREKRAQLLRHGATCSCCYFASFQIRAIRSHTIQFFCTVVVCGVGIMNGGRSTGGCNVYITRRIRGGRGGKRITTRAPKTESFPTDSSLNETRANCLSLFLPYIIIRVLNV